MNIQQGILVGIVAGIITSVAVLAPDDLFTVEAAMGGSGGESSGGMGGDSGGMKGGSPSKHGVWYGPGTVHQTCKKSSDMPPHYCEPYYKAMSSVIGVRITNVDPVDEKTLRVTLKEISIANPGVNQKITVSAGSGDLTGTGIVNGGWSGTTTIDVPLNGMGHIYNHESMHVHIFPVTNG